MKTLSAAVVFFVLVGCAMVDVTKTTKETYNPTNPNDVEILLTRPEKSYVELGMVMVNCFSANYTTEIHNAIRAEAAKLGANAVILITSQGNLPGNEMSVRGVAIRYKTEGSQK